jgi:hypothetical protein
VQIETLERDFEYIAEPFDGWVFSGHDDS